MSCLSRFLALLCACYASGSKTLRSQVTTRSVSDLPRAHARTRRALWRSEAAPLRGAPAHVAQTTKKYACGYHRVVYSLTSLAARLPLVQPALEAMLERQTRPPSKVYLALVLGAAEPTWLHNLEAKYAEGGGRTGPTLEVVRMEKDPGPAAKLLVALEKEAGRHDTLLVYGDDDVVYGPRILEHHLEAHAALKPCGGRVAFAPRVIQGAKISIVEGTGTVSLPAAAVEHATLAKGLADAPPFCRLSDDFWLSYYLGRSGVEFKTLDACGMDWSIGRMAPACFERDLHDASNIGALSSIKVDNAGERVDRGAGGWREQLRRYGRCRGYLEPGWCGSAPGADC